MSLDRFIDQIVTEIELFNNAFNQGYTVVGQSSPARKTWNELPLVMVCAANKTPIKFMAFGQKNVVSNYNLFLCSTNPMINIPNDLHEFFVNGMIGLFMPMPGGIAAAGAWQCRADVNYDFDRNIFPEQFIVSCVTIEISWIYQ